MVLHVADRQHTAKRSGVYRLRASFEEPTTAIGILLFVPWLDRSPVRSSRYRPLYRCFYWLWIGDVVWLGWLATQPVDDHTNLMAQMGTGYYFIFFLIIMPFLPRFERVREPPSITQERTQKRRGCPLWW